MHGQAHNPNVAFLSPDRRRNQAVFPKGLAGGLAVRQAEGCGDWVGVDDAARGSQGDPAEIPGTVGQDLLVLVAQQVPRLVSGLLRQQLVLLAGKFYREPERRDRAQEQQDRGEDPHVAERKAQADAAEVHRPGRGSKV